MNKFNRSFLLFLTLIFLFGCKKDRFDKNPSDQAIVNDNVLVLDSTIFKLKSSEADLENGVYTFDVKGQYSSDMFEPGMVLVGYEGDGFLRKIHTAKATSNGIEFTTTQATMTDVFQKADLKFDLNWDTGEANVYKSGKTEDEDGSVDWEIDFDIPNKTLEEGPVTIGIENGNVKFSPNFTFDLDINSGEVTYVNFGTNDTKIESSLDIYVEAVSSKEEMADITHLKGYEKRFVTWVGYVPVVLKLKVDFFAETSYWLEPWEMRTTLKDDRSLSMGLEYEDGAWSKYFEHGGEGFHIEEFDYSEIIEVGANVKVYPHVELKLYGVAGPFVQPAAKAELIAAHNLTTSDGNIDLDLYTSLLVGAEVDVLGISESWSHEFDGPSFKLYEYPSDVTIVSGNYQLAETPTQLLPEFLKVKVTDYFGNHISGVPVYFTASSNSGTVSIEKAYTDQNGMAKTSWYVGTTGNQTVTTEIRKANGNAASQAIFHASIQDAPNYFLGPFDGKIWNMKGANAGAWDLLGISEMFISNDDGLKDIVNDTPFNLSGSTYDFYNSFTSNNNTLFAPISYSAYGSMLYYDDAVNLYNQSSPETQISNVNTNNCYIAKLRGSNDYATIKITDVVFTSDDDFDYIEFEYKLFEAL